jgi:hypothetical protein
MSDSESLFNVIDKLLDDRMWPTYTNSRLLRELEDFASEAFERDTFDGYLSYVLISHQVCEDYVLLLLRHAQFALRLQVIPNGFGWPAERYEDPGVRAKGMFGALLRELAETIDFKSKTEFIIACRKQNEIRNRFAHRLLDGLTLNEIRDFAQKYRKGSQEVVDSFNDGDDDFTWFYFMQAVDLRWDEIIAAKIKGSEKDEERRKWEIVREKFRANFTKQWKQQDRGSATWREHHPAPSWMV